MASKLFPLFGEGVPGDTEDEKGNDMAMGGFSGNNEGGGEKRNSLGLNFLGAPASVEEIVRSCVKQFARLERDAMSRRMRENDMEDGRRKLERLLVHLAILCQRPTEGAAARKQGCCIAREACGTELLTCLCLQLPTLNKEAQKKGAIVFTSLIDRRWSGKQVAVQYMREHKLLLDSLLMSYNSDAALFTGQMLRRCAHHEPLAKLILESPIFTSFFTFIETAVSEQVSDNVFAALREVLTRHRGVVADWLRVNHDLFFKGYITMLRSPTAKIRLQALRLLGDVFADPGNVGAMSIFVQNATYFSVIIELLRDDTKGIQVESLYTLALFLGDAETATSIVERSDLCDLDFMEEMEDLLERLSVTEFESILPLLRSLSQTPLISREIIRYLDRIVMFASKPSTSILIGDTCSRWKLGCGILSVVKAMMASQPLPALQAIGLSHTLAQCAATYPDFEVRDRACQYRKMLSALPFPTVQRMCALSPSESIIHLCDDRNTETRDYISETGKSFGLHVTRMSGAQLNLECISQPEEVFDLFTENGREQCRVRLPSPKPLVIMLPLQLRITTDMDASAPRTFPDTIFAIKLEFETSNGSIDSTDTITVPFLSRTTAGQDSHILSVRMAVSRSGSVTLHSSAEFSDSDGNDWQVSMEDIQIDFLDMIMPWQSPRMGELFEPLWLYWVNNCTTARTLLEISASRCIEAIDKSRLKYFVVDRKAFDLLANGQTDDFVSSANEFSAEIRMSCRVPPQNYVLIRFHIKSYHSVVRVCTDLPSCIRNFDVFLGEQLCRM